MFIYIIIAWVLGMVAYILLGSKDIGGVDRCNVKEEVIRFRNINNKVNKATRNK